MKACIPAGIMLLLGSVGLFFWADGKVSEANSLPGAMTRGITALFSPNSSRSLEAEVQKYANLRLLGIGGMMLGGGLVAIGLVSMARTRAG